MARRRRILFLCTGNSCRSQMAEALLRDAAPDQFEACSAGSSPAGFVHPLAISALARLNISMEHLRSKSWDEFIETPVDVVLTLCDRAANESCPVFPGNPIRAHWSLPDPVGYWGRHEEAVEFAYRVAQRLRTKIQRLVELDWSMDREVLTRRLRFLGDI